MRVLIYRPIFFLLIATGIATSVLIMQAYATFKEISSLPPDPVLISMQHTQQPTAPPQSPHNLIIPKLDVNASVEFAGLDANGIMETPQDPDSVAWYKLGNIPGTSGNAVIAGHFDWVHGPAVFYRLRELEPGDQIVIMDEENQHWEFTVTRIASYPENNFPLEEVFADSAEVNLNLITCDGIFDASKKSYSERMVVYTTLTNYET